MDGDFISVARVSDLPPAGGLEVTVKGRKIALFKTSEGVFAIDALCPHRQAPLWVGWVEGTQVACAMHGWEFDLRTGACRTKPDHAVNCYEVRVVGAEVLVKA